MASNSKGICEMYLSSTLNTSELKHSCAPSTPTPHRKCEKASRCQYWLTWLIRLIHWGRERGSMAAVISKCCCFLCVLTCCSYRLLDVSYLIFFENSTAEMLVSQLADITGPGTQRHIFHGTSGQLFHKFCQLLPSQGFHLKGFHGYLPWQEKPLEWEWSDSKGVFKKGRDSPKCAMSMMQIFRFDLSSHLNQYAKNIQKTESPSWRRHHFNCFYMISHCFQLLYPAGTGSTWRCSKVSNYHDSAPLWIGQTWAARWKPTAS